MSRVRRSVGVPLGALLAVVLGVALAGCVGSRPGPTKTPFPSATPLYSSDAKALAAASEAYSKYIEVSNQIGQAGWKDISPLKTVASGPALQGDERSAKANYAKGLHISGSLVGNVVRVQSIGPESVTVYTCLNVSGTRIIDSSGADVTSSDRADVYPFQVTFAESGGRLLLRRSSVWSGTSFC